MAALALMLAAAAFLGIGGREALEHLREDHPAPLLAIGLLVLAGVLGVISILPTRQSLRALEQRLLTLRGMERVGTVEPPDSGLSTFADALNGLMQLAEDEVHQAALQVKELEIQLKVATAERQHVEAVLYSISDAVMVTDSYDELLIANDSAARVFDFELDAGRRPIGEVLRDQKMVELIGGVRQRASRSGRQIVEHSVETPVGPRTFKVTLSCVTDRAGRPAGVVTVLHDMTRERELAQMKNDFVSHVSHELRTPLASIKAYTEMLIDGEATDDETRNEFYEVVHNEAIRLERLIDNILNISRIESGLVRVNKAPQSLMVLCKEALEVITPQAVQKQIAVEEQLLPTIYQTLADRDMLYQAILNLLSNAIKYTPEGGRITVSTVVDEARHKLITRVSDTGVGIPPKDLPYVFDKFYRSEANNRMAKGTGLGLSLVKHIIENVHHGRMFAESEVGKGSTFGFELDLID